MITKNYLAKNLQYLRKNRRLSQLELANALGMTRSKIASYESAKAEPNAGKLSELTRFFNVSLHQLIEEDLQVQQEANIPVRDLDTSKEKGADAQPISIDALVAKSSKLRKIAEGFQALYEMKKETSANVPQEAKTQERDIESLFDVIDNLIKLNEELLFALQTSLGAPSS